MTLNNRLGLESPTHSADLEAKKEEDTESEVRLGNEQQPIKLQNSHIFNDLGIKLSHLPSVFRKVNDKTKTDSFPIPRIADCIDQIGNAKFVSTFDMLKGYWQVPLSQRARKISVFVTLSGLYQYKVMPFGMKNAPATFQRMVYKVRDLE